MSENNEFERIYKQIEKQSDKIDHSTRKIEVLAESVAELAKVIATKEVNDNHMQKTLDSLSEKIAKIEEEVNKLKLINAGDDLWRKLMWLGLSAIVIAVIGGVLALVIPK